MSLPTADDVLRSYTNGEGYDIALYGDGTVQMAGNEYDIETLRKLVEHWDYVEEIGDNWEPEDDD